MEHKLVEWTWLSFPLMGDYSDQVELNLLCKVRSMLLTIQSCAEEFCIRSVVCACLRPMHASVLAWKAAWRWKSQKQIIRSNLFVLQYVFSTSWWFVFLHIRKAWSRPWTYYVRVTGVLKHAQHATWKYVMRGSRIWCRSFPISYGKHGQRNLFCVRYGS